MVTAAPPRASRRPTPRSSGRSAVPWTARASTTATWVILLLWAVFTLLPIIWLLLAVTKSGGELSTRNPFAFGSLERVVEGWRTVRQYDDGAVVKWIWNTVVLTVGGVVLALVTTLPAGYAAGTLRFPGRRLLLLVSLGMMLVPISSLVLPLFLEMNELGLVGNRLSVILPLSVFPFGLYVTFIYFSTTISHDVYDAARLDGCSEWQVFRHIAIPLARPIAGLVAFFAFIRNWNDFLLPFIMLGTDKYPLPVGLALIARESPDLNPGVNSVSPIGAPEVLIVVFLTMAPVLIAILLAQRTIVRGADILGGGLRG